MKERREVNQVFDTPRTTNSHVHIRQQSDALSVKRRLKVIACIKDIVTECLGNHAVAAVEVKADAISVCDHVRGMK